MSRFPNSSISSGLCTPMPCALTFLIPWNHWIWDNHQQNKHTHTNVTQNPNNRKKNKPIQYKQKQNLTQPNLQPTTTQQFRTHKKNQQIKSRYEPCVQKWIGIRSSKICSVCEHPMHVANQPCIPSKIDRDTWFATKIVSKPNDFQSSKSWHEKCYVVLVSTMHPNPYRICYSIPWLWLLSQRSLRHSIRWMEVVPFWIVVSVYGRHSVTNKRFFFIVRLYLMTN